MSPHLSRRRFIGITAAAMDLSLVPFGRPAEAGTHLVTWHGQAMGAVASLRIHHHDRSAAERLIERSLAEVHRLEQVFSLYRSDSALSVLNRQGVLIAPPSELVSLLAECRRYAQLTGGAFDPTVQPLWALYRDHFSTPGADPEGPSRAALQTALDRVEFGHVTFDPDRIVLRRRGMALTLNGIAPGYVTDRIVDLMRSAGIGHSLVDMGEPRALDARLDGGPWRIGIACPDDPSRVADTLEIVDKAAATSGAYGFRFDPAGRFNHLLDPRTGGPSRLHASVTAVMPTATAADALSTAFSLMSREEIARVLGIIRGRAYLITHEGERLPLGG
jgi:FAD:protein FMN transferase